MVSIGATPAPFFYVEVKVSNFFKVGMQKKDLIIRIAGDGGQGVVTSGEMLYRAIAQTGLNILTESTFASEIMGGDADYQVRVSPSPIFSQGDRVDILVALSGRAYQGSKANLAPGCVMIYDEEAVKPEGLEGVIRYPIPMSSIGKGLGSPISRNMVALGALTKLLCLPEDRLRELIQKKFSNKSPSLLRVNLEAFDEGISYVKVQIRKRDPYLLPVGIKKDSLLLLNGNEAVGLGALISGCRFYSYCPITPATTIGDWLSGCLPNLNGSVIQTEDAVESLGLAIGASYAGRKAMTATSGPGLDLMQELIGFASMAEIPVVIVEVQRAGPSQGLATKHEQSDLFAAALGSHGDVPKIVLAPSDVHDCLSLTIEAFNLSERHQVPVILLSDASLSRRSQTVPRPDLSKILIMNRTLYDGTQSPYVRFRITQDGISPMAVPGQSGRESIATGIEHTENGFPSDHPQNHKIMTDKRFRKLETLEEEFLPIEREGPLPAEVGIISWGIAQGAVREAMQRFQQIGLEAAALYPKQLWPLPVKALKSFAESVKKVVVVEANKQGQLAHLIQAYAGIQPQQIQVYTGIPISPWEIFGQEGL